MLCTQLFPPVFLPSPDPDMPGSFVGESPHGDERSPPDDPDACDSDPDTGFPICPRPPGKLPASIRRPLTLGSMGISPLRGSLRAVPIACSCGWTEVSLSLVCFIALPVVARLFGMTGIPAPLLMVSFVTAFAAEASSRVSLWLEVSLPYRNVPDGLHI